MNTKEIIKLAMFSLALVGQKGYAIFDPSWERPIESAQMQIEESRGYFEVIENLVVQVNKRDGQMTPTSLTISYDAPHDGMTQELRNVSRTFEIPQDAVTKGDCGETVYTINISEEGEGRMVGARTHITLVDYRTTTCRMHFEHKLELSMREGYGWCGTMDATVHAVGNPEQLMSALQK